MDRGVISADVRLRVIIAESDGEMWGGVIEGERWL